LNYARMKDPAMVSDLPDKCNSEVRPLARERRRMAAEFQAIA